MSDEYSELAAYNTRVSQGIVHTDEYRERMRVLQERFDETWRATHNIWRPTPENQGRCDCTAPKFGGRHVPGCPAA